MSRTVFYNPVKVTVEGGSCGGGPGGPLILLCAAVAVIAGAVSWLLANLLDAILVTAGAGVTAGACAVAYAALSRGVLRVSGRLTVPVGLNRLRPAPAAERQAIEAPARLAIEAPKPDLTAAWLAEYTGVAEERQQA